MDQFQSIIQAFTDKANLAWAVVVTALASVLGRHWYLFVFYLVLNVVDFYYGRQKGKKTNTLSSAVGAKGIEKKVSYWVVIGLAFAVSFVLVEMGKTIGVSLDFLVLIGWFTLAVYILNELTSIVENLLVLGYEVPDILVRGLSAARSAVDAAGNKVVPPEKTEHDNKA